MSYIFPSEGIEILRISKEPMLAAENISFIGNKKTIRLKELENKPLLIYRRWEKQIRTAFAEEGAVRIYSVLMMRKNNGSYGR